MESRLANTHALFRLLSLPIQLLQNAAIAFEPLSPIFGSDLVHAHPGALIGGVDEFA